jgi:excisionase family DNA binding protein
MLSGVIFTTKRRRIVSFREAAESLHIGRYKLFRMVKKGEIPGAFRVGSLWRFDLNELESIGRITHRTSALRK